MADPVSPTKPWPGPEISLRDSGRLLGQKLDQLFRDRPRDGPVWVLEVGCGRGNGTATLCNRLQRWYGVSGTRLYALDIDRHKLGEAHRRFHRHRHEAVHLLVADFYQLPISASRFDYVIAFNVVFLADRRRLFQEVHRVLKPEGKVFVYDLLPLPDENQRPLMAFTLTRDQIAAFRSGTATAES